jgi:hypothetical protein
MRKVSIQRGWPPATPIALNTKDEDGIGLSDLARAGIKERRDPHIGRHARSVGTILVEITLVQDRFLQSELRGVPSYN